MAKIIKVGSQNITPNKIANPFKTSRNSTTNPFKYNNFEGTTLPLELAADVFAGAKTEKTNRLRMIASSVTGSMNKMKSSFEPIVNFVNRVRGSISNAWDYAKSTTFTGAMSDAANSIKSSVADKVSAFKETSTYKVLTTDIELNINMPEIKAITALKEGVANRMNAMHEGFVGIGHDMKSQWEAMIAKLPSKTRYTADTPVADLRAAWLEINAAEGGIA